MLAAAPAPGDIQQIFEELDLLTLMPMLGDQLLVKLSHCLINLSLRPSLGLPTLQYFNSVFERESWLEFPADVFDCRFH